MTTDNGKKPREFWILPQKGSDCEWTNLYPDESWKSETKPLIHVREVTPCANCERLEEESDKYRRTAESTYNFQMKQSAEIQRLEKLYQEKVDVSAQRFRFAEKITHLEKQLEMCKDALKFYGPEDKLLYPNDLGKRARECLAKLEKE